MDFLTRDELHEIVSPHGFSIKSFGSELNSAKSKQTNYATGGITQAFTITKKSHAQAPIDQRIDIGHNKFADVAFCVDGTGTDRLMEICFTSKSRISESEAAKFILHINKFI